MVIRGLFILYKHSREFSSGEMKLHKYIIACENFLCSGREMCFGSKSPSTYCSRSFSAGCALGEESIGVATQDKKQLFVQYKSLPGVHTIIDGYSN